MFLMTTEDIPDKIRQQVYERDARRCRLCGVANARAYSVHHIRYRSEGGDNSLANLILLCGTGSWGCHLTAHSDKGTYQPLLLELAVATGVTGLAILRRRSRERTGEIPMTVRRRFG